MRRSDTTYRGERLIGDRGMVLGVRVTVNGRPLSPARSLRVAQHNESGFEWGYTGAGSSQLALALLLDATGDARVATRADVWFRRAVVADWPARWEITAGQVRRWLAQWAHETDQGDVPMVVVGCFAVRRCRVCSCTDADCRQCIEATGEPCSWVEGEPDLCTRCADEADRAIVRNYRPANTKAEGGGS